MYILNRCKYIYIINICKVFNKLFSYICTAFSFKKYCSSLVIVVKMLIFVHSDAEAPP